MKPRFRLRAILESIALAAIAMASLRMSVPERQTWDSDAPFGGFAIIGVWVARSLEVNVILGAMAGGAVGGVANVAMQYAYYGVFYLEPITQLPGPTVLYLGVPFCLLLDMTAGTVVGCTVGCIAKLASLIAVRFERMRKGGIDAKNAKGTEGVGSRQSRK